MSANVVNKKCRIDTLCNDLGINNNPELKAFITLQTFSKGRFNGDYKSNVRGVTFDTSRNKWQARYKPSFETDIIKTFNHRYDTKEEAENEMLVFKRNMLKKLFRKYPNYTVKNTLKRRINSGRGEVIDLALYKKIKDLSDDELIELLIHV